MSRPLYGGCLLFGESVLRGFTVYLVTAQATIRSSSLKHPQLCWVPWHTLSCKLRAAKYGGWVSPINQLQQTLILDSGLAPLPHTQNLFFTIQGVVHAYKFIFKLTILCWMDKMSRVHMVSFCNLIGTARARCRKSTTFPMDVTRLSPPPCFRGESWGRG